MSTQDFVETSLRATAAELFDGAAHVTHRALVDLGWEELLASEPRAAVSALAEVQGRHLGTSRLTELVMASSLGLDPDDTRLGFPLGGPLCRDTANAVVLATELDSSTIVLPVLAHDRVGLSRLPVEAVEVEAVHGIDPSAGWSRVRCTDALHLGDVVAETVWQRALAMGSLAVAHELIGVSQGLLDLAVDHVRERVQFGVAIGTFQAVQHRLADVHVHVEAARAISSTAWGGGEPVHATATLVAARTAFTVAAQHCHQVLGAMGCTWEHDAHRYIRRGMVLQVLLDPAAALRSIATGVAMSTDRVEVLA